MAMHRGGEEGTCHGWVMNKRGDRTGRPWLIWLNFESGGGKRSKNGQTPQERTGSIARGTFSYGPKSQWLSFLGFFRVILLN